MNRNSTSSFLGRISAGVLAVAVSLTLACTKKVLKKPPIESREASSPFPLPEPNIHDAQFVGTPELKAIIFDFDRHDLKQDAREILKKNAHAIKKIPGRDVLVEGHCDDRGTAEYNLALGQHRAKAVRDYYLLLGVPGNRVATISYGEEKPLCGQSDQACASRNRRAETKLRTETAVTQTNPPQGG